MICHKVYELLMSILNITNTRVYFINIICINNLLPFDFQPNFGKAIVTAKSSLFQY
jgi:hypothetical protein